MSGIDPIHFIRRNVKVIIREDGKALWLHDEFGCFLRVSGIENLFVDDNRGKTDGQKE